MALSLRRRPLLLVLVLLLVPLARASAADDLATALSHLKRAEANLELVDGSIGHLTKPPTGSAARLAKMRLEQAWGDLEPAAAHLKKASGEGVAAAVKRYNDDIALYEKLRKILTGETPKPDPAPEPKPAEDPAPEKKGGDDPKPAPAKPETVKLGYPHADNFKNALFTLRRVEADADGIVTLLEELRPVEDQLSIDHRRVAQAVGLVTETRRQAGFAETALAKIPANGEGVAEAKQRLVNASAKVTVGADYFGPLHDRLQKLIHPSNYPQFEADLKRLKEMSTAYQNLDYLFREQRLQVAETYGQNQEARAQCVEVIRKYARLIQQATDQGKRLEHAGNAFLRGHEAFLARTQTEAAALPASIREDLAEANRMADEAVAAQKPMWFTGGIPQRMGWAQDKFGLLSVLDPAGAQAVGAEMQALEASLRTRADSLRELIIRENRPPEDRFAGADRDAAIAVAVDAWKVQQPEFELLSVRIPAEAWTRETKWTYSNGTWYFVDRSTLQVRLIVADGTDSKLAIDRPINVRKDHQKGDTMIGVPMRSFDEELQPSEYFLRANVK